MDPTGSVRFGRDRDYPVNIPPRRMATPRRRPDRRDDGEALLGLRPATRRIPARIWLDGETLCWEETDHDRETEAKADARLLREFIDLADPKDPSDLADRVRLFARDHGVLGLCRHGLLPYHLGAHPKPCAPTGREAVTQWQRWSARARAAWLCTGALQRRRKADPDEEYRPWEMLGLPMRDATRLSVDRLKGLLSLKLSLWFREAGAWPEVSWSDSERQPHLRIGGPTVFAAVLQELTMATARTDRFRLCAGCGQSVVPKRRPKPGQSTWCEDCAERGLPKKAARRAYRERKARERRGGRRTGKEDPSA